MVRKLLRLGADPNSQDNAGNKFSNIKNIYSLVITCFSKTTIFILNSHVVESWHPIPEEILNSAPKGFPSEYFPEYTPVQELKLCIKKCQNYVCFFLKLNFIITLLQRSSFLCQEHFVFPVYQSWLQRLGLTWENDIFSFHELVYQELCSTSLGPEPRGLGLII